MTKERRKKGKRGSRAGRTREGEEKKEREKVGGGVDCRPTPRTWEEDA